MDESLFPPPPPSINNEVLKISERTTRITSMWTKEKADKIEFALKFGRELNALKDQCAYEQKDWLPVLETACIPHSTATNYMNADLHRVEIRDFISKSLGNGPPTWVEIIEFMQTLPCDRACRLNNGCKKCEKRRKKAAAKESVKAAESAQITTGKQPETDTTAETTPREDETPEPKFHPSKARVVDSKKLKEILGEADTYQKLARSAKILSKKIRKLERGDVHRMLIGRMSEKLADSALDISKTLERTAPKAPCPTCGGAIVNSSNDSEPCKGCGIKGVLTAAEVERLEKQNASK